MEKKSSVILRDYNCLILCLVLFVGSSIFIPGFTNPLNILNILTETSVIGILAVGMTFLLLLGLFDMSIGMQVSMYTLVAAKTIHLGIVPCIIIMAAVGVMIGCANGFLTAKLKINALITTFAMQGILQGLTLVISEGKTLPIIDESFNAIFATEVLGLPVSLIIFIILAVFAQFWLRYTKKGFEIYVVGGNSEAAKLSGVNTFAVSLISFVFMSLCAVLVAILLASRMYGASPTLGSGYTLLVITSCVIGGVKFNGGYGNILNTVLGVLAMQLVNDMMYMTNTYGYVQSLINGLILIAVLGLDAVTSRLIARRKAIDV